MKISNAYCKKHDEIEPESQDILVDGLWSCPKCKPKLKLINGMKPLDYAIKQAEKKLDSLKK